MKIRFTKSVLLFTTAQLLGPMANAFTCDLTEVDLSQTPSFKTKSISHGGGTVRGDMYPDIGVTIHQTKNGSMHINIASVSRNLLYAEGFGQLNAGVTAFLERDDDSKQVIVLCNDFTRKSVPASPVVKRK